MKKVLTIVLAALMIISLSACGDSEMDAAAGTYKGEYTKLVGAKEDEKETDKEFTLTLKSNGKGTHERDDLTIDVTWELKDGEFKMTETFMGMTLEYTGTLKDGKLDIFNGPKDDMWTYEYVYSKQ